MEEKREIQTIGDIRLLVDTFYEKVRNDDLLSPVFNEIIKDNWEHHLEKMYRFWQTQLLEEHTYQGNPLALHINLPISKKHFERWIMLFRQTLEELFIGEKATLADVKATQITVIFLSKIEQRKGL
jgi:hemoglobin